jgi:hypothetical protein
LTWSELVGQAVAEEEEGVATAGVLLLPGVVPWAVGLAAAVDPDVPGWLLLPDDAHPATAAAQVSATIVSASRPALSFMARR